MFITSSGKLSTTILKSIFIVAIIPTLVIFLISVFFQYNQFDKDKTYVENDFLETKKEDIRREVSRVIELVEYRQSLIRQEIEKKLIDRIDQAYAIATSIYEENIGVKNEDEIKYLIVSALKNISYNEKRAYFYINDTKGNAVLFMKTNKLGSNANIWNLKDVKGNYVVRNHVKIAFSDKGEGFVTNYFNKPDLNDNIEYPKLNYIKHFEPLGWYLGVGEYLDDIENQAKEDILKQIAAIRFGKDGYIFINSIDKEALVSAGEKLSVPKDLSKLSEFQEQWDALEDSSDGYFFTKNRKIGTEEEFPKISFVKTYEKWGWVVGTGVYLDDLEIEVARKAEDLKANILQQFIFITLLMLVIIVVIYYTSKRISSFIDNNMNHLITSFRVASVSHKEINTRDFTFEEFVILTDDLNKTLKSRNEVETKLKSYVQLVNENIIISTLDRNGKIIDASSALVSISGYLEEELVGESYMISLHENNPEFLISDIKSHLERGKVWQGELQCKTKDGKVYWVDSIIYPKCLDDEVVEFTIIQQDITDKKNVEYLSITDELTKLNNRRYFNTKLEEELNRAKRENNSIGFMMFDVDFFKKYNDTYGHQAGDKALQKVAQVLIDKTKRASDFAFRLGGEEFGILFSVSKGDPLEYANLIRTEIEKLHIEHKENESSPYLTVSIGLNIKHSQEITSSNDFFKATDDALYAAKKAGRNRTLVSGAQEIGDTSQQS